MGGNTASRPSGAACGTPRATLLQGLRLAGASWQSTAGYRAATGLVRRNAAAGTTDDGRGAVSLLGRLWPLLRSVARFPVRLVQLAARILLWLWGFQSFDWGSGLDVVGMLEQARSAGAFGALLLLSWRVLGLALKSFKFIAAPDVVVRQLVTVVVLQFSFELSRWCWRRVRQRVVGEEAGRLDRRGVSNRVLLRRSMQRARTYQEWKKAAALLDSAEGLDAWKHNHVSEHFDYRQLQHHMVNYTTLRRRGEVETLMWHLRAELHRKTFGLANENLHNKCRVGSKQIIEHYMATVASCLDYVCDCEADSEPREATLAKLEFFNETRHAYGRSALLLSGGATMGLYHLGVIQALLKEGLLPRVISGSSAGSIITAMLGVKTDEELQRVLELGTMNLRFFGVKGNQGSAIEESDSVFARLWRSVRVNLPMPVQVVVNELGRVVPRWLKTRTLLDIDVLAESLRSNIGDMTFGEAFLKTRRIINITVSPAGSHNMPMLLNYLTAPHVLIWTAAAASCAIPGVFAPVDLLAKGPDGVVRPYLSGGVKWSDGSVEMDLPMARLSELFNVNMFVVAQVNPHARLFSGLELGNGLFAQTIRFLKRQIRTYVENISHVGLSVPFVKLLGRSLVPLVTQRYEGDVTIVPPFSWRDVANLLTNPTKKMFYRAVDIGERCTWEKIPRLYTRCLVEFTLDECVRRLRARVMLPSEQQGLGRVPSFHTSASRGLLNSANIDGNVAAALSDVSEPSGRGGVAPSSLSSGTRTPPDDASPVSPPPRVTSPDDSGSSVVSGLYRSARTRGSHVRFGSALDLAALDVAAMGVDLEALARNMSRAPAAAGSPTSSPPRRRRSSTSGVPASRTPVPKAPTRRQPRVREGRSGSTST